MLPIPYDRFTIHSRLSVGDAAARVSDLVDRNGSFFFGLVYDRLEGGYEGARQFRGRVSADGFRVFRIIRYRNAFLPVVRGAFVAREGAGTDIRVSMSLHPGVVVFIAFVALGTLLGALVGQVWNLPVVGILLLGLILIYAGFWSEALKARRILTRELSPELP